MSHPVSVYDAVIAYYFFLLHCEFLFGEHVQQSPDQVHAPEPKHLFAQISPMSSAVGAIEIGFFSEDSHRVPEVPTVGASLVVVGLQAWGKRTMSEHACRHNTKIRTTMS